MTSIPLPILASGAAADGHGALSAAATTVAVALAAGMIAQVLARHLKLPGIVLLLGFGVLLGPDVANLVHPQELKGALQVLVGFAVAVILFEGGMNLDIRRLRREAVTIRRLLTVGVLITAVGATLAVKYLMQWDWMMSVLFGTLVIVTGPTVITPLLRRIKVKHRVETVLEAEGVLIDPIGAIIAVVALQVAVSPQDFLMSPVQVITRLLAGLVLGLAGGYGLGLLLRNKKLVPAGLENVFSLSLVLALFHVSNEVLEESGIMTVTAAGVVFGNMHTRVQRELQEFKEQLTVMFIGMLFVLLAADVRLAEVQALGWPGVATVAVLMLVVRPINILACTWGTDLTWREKTFLSWLSPRGVVAAAVASLFAQEVTRFGIEGGDALRALVFMVIAVTVVLQGLTGGLLASVLGLKRAVQTGFVILGANELGHGLGRVLRDCGQKVSFIDSSPAACKVVAEDGFKVTYGNAIEERTLQRARLGDQAVFVAVTPNEEVNLLVSRVAAEEFHVAEIRVASRRDQLAVGADRIHRDEAHVLFGRPRDLELWALRMRRELATVVPFRLGESRPDDENPFDMPEGLLLPMVRMRKDRATLVHSGTEFRKGDVVFFSVFGERRDEADAWLGERGWQLAADAASGETGR